MSFNFGFDLGEAEGGSAAPVPLTDVTMAPICGKSGEGPGEDSFPATEVPQPAGPVTAFATTISFRVARAGTGAGVDGSTPVVPLAKVDLSQHPEQLSAGSVPVDHDIVPATYGGGYKTWECSLDLVQYLLDNGIGGGDGRVSGIAGSGAGSCRAPHEDAAVLELGCGHGLPAAAALRHLGYHSAVLNDLNAEVLRDAAWPNLLLNGVDSTAVSGATVRCVAGHWLRLSEALGRRRFELVLSAETAYSDSNAALLVELARRHIAYPNGVALVATKRFYFGLGGGTLALQQAAAAAGMSCETVRGLEDGASNIRDIVLLRHLAAPA